MVCLSYFDQRQKPKNNTLERQENAKEIIINHKGTRIVKDGED